MILMQNAECRIQNAELAFPKIGVVKPFGAERLRGIE